MKKGINDYKSYQRLAGAPIQMAMRIIELENQFKQYQIGSDPNRRLALLERLKKAKELSETNPEEGHIEAEDILLEFINDEEVSELYGTVKRFYS